MDKKANIGEKPFWYDQEEEKALVRWTAERKRMFREFCLSGETKSDLKKYPLTPDQCFAKPPQVMPSESYQKWYCDYKRLSPHAAFGPEGNYWNDPMPKPKDLYYPFPRPGELYECGKVEYDRFKEPNKPIGKVIITGVGGGFKTSDELEQFQKLWNDSGIFYHRKNQLTQERGTWRAYDVNTKFTTRMGWLDFGDPLHMGLDEEILLL